MTGLCEQCGQPVGFHRVPLTRRQREVFNWIAAFYGANEFAPTLTEVAQHFVTTVSTVQEHVENLRAKGWLIPAEKYKAHQLVPMESA